MHHVLLIDHYDSFTETIKSYFEVLGARVSVFQFDDTKLSQLEALEFTHIVLSPGPGSPSEVMATQGIIRKYYARYPILGVCLGHQCIVEAFGGEVIQASAICHGKTSTISHKARGLFEGIDSPFEATRYHSLLAAPQKLPKNLQVTAWSYDTNEQVIMGVQHEKHPLFGVQFHPEAILTSMGYRIFSNFLE